MKCVSYFPLEIKKKKNLIEKLSHNSSDLLSFLKESSLDPLTCL